MTDLSWVHDEADSWERVTMARMNVNKRIAKAMNTDSQLSHFVINVLNPDYIKDSKIIDETTFEYVVNFIHDYDATSITDIMKGNVLKVLSNMLFTGDDDDDFDNFLGLLAQAIDKSKDILEVVMDIHNCISLERDDLDEVELVRNINLVLAMNAFDAFRNINDAEIVSEAASTSTDNNDNEVKPEKESELSTMKSVKTGRTIIFGNGHTAHTVVADNDKVEHVEAEIVSKAASESTDKDKATDDDIKLAEAYLKEMSGYPQFEQYTKLLTTEDVVSYQKAIQNGTMEGAFDYIHKIADKNNNKATALFVLFMGNIASEVMNRLKSANLISDATSASVPVSPDPMLPTIPEPNKPVLTSTMPQNQEPKKPEAPVRNPHVNSTPFHSSKSNSKPVKKEEPKLTADGYKWEDHNGYYLHLKRIGLV